MLEHQRPDLVTVGMAAGDGFGVAHVDRPARSSAMR
jgi:hypothetical protein